MGSFMPSSSSSTCVCMKFTEEPRRGVDMQRRPATSRRVLADCRTETEPMVSNDTTLSDYSSAGISPISSATRLPIHERESSAELIERDETDSSVALLVPTVVDPISGESVIDARALHQIVASYNFSATSKSRTRRIDRRPDSGCDTAQSRDSVTSTKTVIFHGTPDSVSSLAPMRCASKKPKRLTATSGFLAGHRSASVGSLLPYGVVAPHWDFATMGAMSADAAFTVGMDASGVPPTGRRLDKSLDFLATQLTPLSESPKMAALRMTQAASGSALVVEEVEGLQSTHLIPPRIVSYQQKSLDEALSQFESKSTTAAAESASDKSSTEMEAVEQMLEERSQRYMERVSQGVSVCTQSKLRSASASPVRGRSRKRVVLTQDTDDSDNSDRAVEAYMALKKKRSHSMELRPRIASPPAADSESEAVARIIAQRSEQYMTRLRSASAGRGRSRQRAVRSQRGERYSQTEDSDKDIRSSSFESSDEF